MTYLIVWYRSYHTLLPKNIKRAATHMRFKLENGRVSLDTSLAIQSSDVLLSIKSGTNRGTFVTRYGHVYMKEIRCYHMISLKAIRRVQLVSSMLLFLSTAYLTNQSVPVKKAGKLGIIHSFPPKVHPILRQATTVLTGYPSFDRKKIISSVSRAPILVRNQPLVDPKCSRRLVPLTG
jgi:hypothetical protein